jgi:hypothetical protein
MTADDEAEPLDVPYEQHGVVNSELAQERQRRLALSRKVRILEDSLAEARSEVLSREQAAQAARFRVVEETEARLAAESHLASAVDRLVATEARAAELTENLRAIHATRTLRYTRYLRKIYGLALRRRESRHPAG